MVSRDGFGRVAVGRILSGHRLSESVPKALKEEGRVEASVWVTLSILLGDEKGEVVHGNRRTLLERVITGTVRYPFIL